MGNSADRPNTRYSQGGETDTYDDRLGWWKRDIYEPAEDDILFEINEENAYNAHKIANEMFDDAQLAWVVLTYNNIVDPFVELSPGTVIRLPSERRLTLEILGSANKLNDLRN